ncbi:MAG: hypothetical protein ACI8YQ_001788 [Polaribacter sp.]|jgi:hypothetical protein
MLKNILNFSFVFTLFSLTFFTSCDKDSDGLSAETTTEAFTTSTMAAIQREASAGPEGCFEFVFPITIEFADATSQTLNDYVELKAAILAWKEANPDATERPNLVFPLEVISQDGEVLSVTDREELRALKRACRNGNNGHGKCKRPCFNILFPITISFPDGTTAEAADRLALKTLVRAWKEANPDATERPVIVFPIEVEMKADGSIVEVADKEALKILKESCQDDEE